VPDVLVLCYHAVSERWDASLAVSPEELEGQVEYLLRRGYRGATFHDAVTSPRSDRTLAVTFDDGYKSVSELAGPILERLGVPGTVFVPTDWIGRDEPMVWPGIEQWGGGEFESELCPMTWDDARALQASGWEIGSHTCSHPHLTQCAADQLETELERSRAVCEAELGGPCVTLAYPYGDLDARVMAATSAAGYRAAAALPSRFHAPLPLSWPRVGVYHGQGMAKFRRHTSRGMRWLQVSPMWPAAVHGLRVVRRQPRRAYD
jgi:peptidoglycan/xylan/chitin deacetylase (PgdA/CDA1 family)